MADLMLPIKAIVEDGPEVHSKKRANILSDISAGVASRVMEWIKRTKRNGILLIPEFD